MRLVYNLMDYHTDKKNSGSSVNMVFRQPSINFCGHPSNVSTAVLKCGQVLNIEALEKRTSGIKQNKQKV